MLRQLMGLQSESEPRTPMRHLGQLSACDVSSETPRCTRNRFSHQRRAWPVDPGTAETNVQLSPQAVNGSVCERPDPVLCTPGGKVARWQGGKVVGRSIVSRELKRSPGLLPAARAWHGQV